MASDFDQKVGALLKTQRIKAKKKQREAGQKIGLSEGQMSRKESGEYSTSSEELAILAGFYGCEVSDFIPKAKKRAKP